MQIRGLVVQRWLCAEVVRGCARRLLRAEVVRGGCAQVVRRLWAGTLAWHLSGCAQGLCAGVSEGLCAGGRHNQPAQPKIIVRLQGHNTPGHVITCISAWHNLFLVVQEFLLIRFF